MTEKLTESEFIYISNLICADKELNTVIALEIIRKLLTNTFINKAYKE